MMLDVIYQSAAVSFISFIFGVLAFLSLWSRRQTGISEALLSTIGDAKGTVQAALAKALIFFSWRPLLNLCLGFLAAIFVCIQP